MARAPHLTQDKFATCEEIAELYSTPKKPVSVRIVQKWCIDGLVDAVKTPGGREWRVIVDDDGYPVDGPNAAENDS